MMMIAVFAVSFLIVYFINWLLHRHDSHCPSFFQWREWYAYQRALQERQLKQLEEERRTVARSTEPRPDQWEDWETDRLNQVKAEEEWVEEEEEEEED